MVGCGSAAGIHLEILPLLDLRRCFLRHYTASLKPSTSVRELHTQNMSLKHEDLRSHSSTGIKS